MFNEPQLTQMLPLRVAVVTTQGDPNLVSGPAMKALYGAVYKLKFERKQAGVLFKVAPLRARWPDAHRVDKSQWTAHWALPVPADVSQLVQKVPGVEVRLETWEYGTVGQILHLGEYVDETPTIQRLVDFIAAGGYEIAGTHEEEYLTRMDAKARRTFIRYPVRPRPVA
ncbi:MAG: GyrI-like domain-containing protein [Anaerolineaceae bacterium]|nr:GyrI-like domain-containing protein [Anaerolineaceae bacterium]